MNQPSLTASEDFSRVLQQLPGAFIPLGATPAGADPSEAAYNHSDRALFNESILSQGALLLADLAISRLQQEEIS